MTGRAVKYAKLQTEYFTTGFGSLGTTLDTRSKHAGMKLTLTDSGLEGSYKGVDFFISMGNIVGVTFERIPVKPVVSPVPSE